MERFACLLTHEQSHPALLELAGRITPVLEEARPGRVYLDITGERDERRLLSLPSAFPFKAGAASSRVAARIAAQHAEAEDPVVIAPGAERDFLSPLPVSFLEPPAELAQVLETWGLRTLGALAAIPEREVSRRLGAPGRLLHLAARGLDERPLLPRRSPQQFAETAQFDWGVYDLPSFIELGQVALEGLSAALRYAGMSARELDFVLELEDASRRELNVPLAAPTTDVKTWQVLLGLELSKWPPADGIVGFTVTAQAEVGRTAQLSLFEPPAQSPDAVATTIARLAALIGPDRVGTPRVVDRHDPERFALGPYVAPPPVYGRGPGGEPSSRQRIAVRVLRPAIELEAILDEKGAPVELKTIRLRREQPGLAGHVRVASGPWKLEQRWWVERADRRAYWDVELSDGALYRIYEDAAGRWFADGIYD